MAGPCLTERSLHAAVARTTVAGLLDCYSYTTSSIDGLVVVNSIRRRLGSTSLTVLEPTSMYR